MNTARSHSQREQVAAFGVVVIPRKRKPSTPALRAMVCATIRQTGKALLVLFALAERAERDGSVRMSLIEVLHFVSYPVAGQTCLPLDPSISGIASPGIVMPHV